MTLRWSGLTVAGVAVLIVMGSACTNASPTPTESGPSIVMVTNVRILTPTPAPSPTPTPTISEPPPDTVTNGQIGTPTSSPTPEQSLGDVARGQELFDQQRCAICHGTVGEGGFAPALNTAEFAQEFATDAAIEAALRTGVGKMPAYGTDKLTDQEVADLIAYMRSL